MVVHDAILVGLAVLEHINDVAAFAQNVLENFDLPLLPLGWVLAVVRFLSFLKAHFHPEFSAIVD